MRYVSTRGDAPELEFDDVLLAGLAVDGGLYVPRSIPTLSSIPDASMGYAEVAAQVIRPFVGDGLVAQRLEEMCADAYGAFAHPDVAPITEITDDLHLLELYWGPTLSFKDYALQLVGSMFDVVLTEREQRVMVLGATSGDTGSAAIAACEGRDSLDIVILYPDGRVSDVQRRQMTTVASDNVRAVAIPGTFDDCQDLVKAAFNDPAIRGRFSLAAVNSINWARVMAQTAYYWWVASQLRKPFSVAVPTGNFGNVLAASVAQRMGAPIERMIVGNNANHGLETLIATGTLPLNPVSPTLAPAMDIAVPSNLERYLHGLLGESGSQVAAAMSSFRSSGGLVLDEVSHAQMSSTFVSGWVDDGGIEHTMSEVYTRHGVTIDPHTAVAWKVGSDHRRPGEVMVVVATAHPAKFGDAVMRVTGTQPTLPGRAAAVMELPERTFSVDPDLNSLVDLLATVGDSTAG